MHAADKHFLIEMRDATSDPNVKRALRMAIKEIEKLEKQINETKTLLRIAQRTLNGDDE